MRRHKAFPKPGDRIRLAIPLPTDTSAPRARFGTVLERSCGQSNALRVRWDHEAGPAVLGPDAGAESWLADAGWYWDKAHLEVVGAHDGDGEISAAALAQREAAAANGDDAWLATTPLAGASASGGVDGSLDAVAEWEAALASEIDDGADAGWEELLANALGQGAPAGAPRKARPEQAAPAAPPGPAAVAVAPQPAAQSAPSPATRPVDPPVHKDIRRRAPSPEGRMAESAPKSEPEEAPAPPPVQAWNGDDILPARRSGGKRWGRR